MSSHRFSRNGQKLYYESYGEGPPLIFVHSYLANRTMWDQEVERFSQTHQVVVVDLRGHGHSGASAPHTLYDMVDDVIAVLDHAKITSAIWCGLSIGGMITMRAAIRYPERVARMILLNTDGRAESARNITKHKALAVLVRTLGVKPALNPIMKLMFGPSAHAATPALIAHWKAELAQVHVPSMLRSLTALDKRDDVLNALRDVHIPALVIHGIEDTAIHHSRGQALANALPSAEYQLYDQMGHLSNLERPELIYGAITSFLNEA